MGDEVFAGQWGCRFWWYSGAWECWLVGRGALCVCFGAHPELCVLPVEEGKGWGINKETTRSLSDFFSIYLCPLSEIIEISLP